MPSGSSAANGKRLSGQWQTWANASLVPTVAGQVTIRLTGCPGLPKAAGCVYTRAPRVVYLRRDVRHPRAVLLHELGHVYDLTVMSNSDRGAFRRIMRRPHAQWWRGKIPLAEWFAEAYSWCARYARIASVDDYAIYSYDPTPAQHRADLRADPARRARPHAAGAGAHAADRHRRPGAAGRSAGRADGRARVTRRGTPARRRARTPATTPTPTPTPRPTVVPVADRARRPRPTPTPTPDADARHRRRPPTPAPTPTPTPTPDAGADADADPDAEPTEDPTPTAHADAAA